MVSRPYYLSTLKRKAFMAEMAAALDNALVSMGALNTDAYGQCEEVLVEYRRRIAPDAIPRPPSFHAQMTDAIDRGLLKKHDLEEWAKKIDQRNLEILCERFTSRLEQAGLSQRL